MVRQDGKSKADGLTLILLKADRSLTWDVTVVCTTADSYIGLATQGPGCVAEMPASRKEAKYATLQSHFDFQPIAFETLSPINESSTSFLYDLGRRILLVSEDRERQFLFQRISVAIQCFNAVQLHAVFFFVFRPSGLVPAPDFNFLH